MAATGWAGGDALCILFPPLRSLGAPSTRTLPAVGCAVWAPQEEDSPGSVSHCGVGCPWLPPVALELRHDGQRPIAHKSPSGGGTVLDRTTAKHIPYAVKPERPVSGTCWRSP